MVKKLTSAKKSEIIIFESTKTDSLHVTVTWPGIALLIFDNAYGRGPLQGECLQEIDTCRL